jgi:hypothetical protein
MVNLFQGKTATHFTTIYKDKNGQENSYFESDGSVLKIKLRGIQFSGISFDYLKPSSFQLEEAQKLFEFNDDKELTSFKMLVDVPIKVRHNVNLIDAALNFETTVGESDFPTTKKFSIVVDNNNFDVINGEEKTLFFESLLIALQKKLPIEYKINTCLFCALSHYSVYGSDKYGTLICYRDLKDEILSINNKSDFVDLTDNKGFNVQETFYCNAFTKIKAGLWLYKDTA